MTHKSYHNKKDKHHLLKKNMKKRELEEQEKKFSQKIIRDFKRPPDSYRSSL